MISTLARWTAFIAVTVILVLGRPVIGSLAFSDPAPSASARSAADRTAAARSAPRVVVQWGDPERDHRVAVSRVRIMRCSPSLDCRARIYQPRAVTFFKGHVYLPDYVHALKRG